VTAAHGTLQDEAAEAARQRRILAALDLTPMQVRACKISPLVHPDT